MPPICICALQKKQRMGRICFHHDVSLYGSRILRETDFGRDPGTDPYPEIFERLPPLLELVECKGSGQDDVVDVLGVAERDQSHESRGEQNDESRQLSEEPVVRW